MPTIRSGERSTLRPTLRVRSDAQAPQVMSELIRAPVHLFVGQLMVAGHHRDRAGRSFHLRLEQLVQAPVMRVVDRRRVPLHHQLMAFGLGQQRNPADDALWMFGEPTEDLLEMIQHAADLDILEAAGVVVDLQQDLLGAKAGQDQRVVRSGRRGETCVGATGRRVSPVVHSTRRARTRRGCRTALCPASPRPIGGCLRAACARELASPSTGHAGRSARAVEPHPDRRPPELAPS